MWGHHRNLYKHVQLLNQMGYSCVTFNLYKASTIKDSHPFRGLQKLKLRYKLWVEQITDVLDSIQGPKIVITMSGPSIASLIAISQRHDITHVVCDSGPFKELWQCTFRLLNLIWHIPTIPLRALFTTGAYLLWGPGAFAQSQQALRQWPVNVPILSIRGGRDPLVFPENIEGIFKDHPQLKLKTWLIAEAHHMDGLKMFPEDYRKTLEAFLA